MYYLGIKRSSKLKSITVWQITLKNVVQCSDSSAFNMLSDRFFRLYFRANLISFLNSFGPVMV